MSRCPSCGESFSLMDSIRWGMCAECIIKVRAETHRAVRQGKLKHLLEASGVPAAYHGCIRTNWSGDWPVKEKAERGMTLIWGPVGTGKTHLATALLAMFLVNSGRSGLWISSTELINSLRKEARGETVTRIGNIETVPFLVLDDFPTDHLTEFALGTLTALISYRFDRQLDTVVTTNLSPSQIAELSHRAASRLCSDRIIKLEGKDQRVARRRL